MNMADYSVQSYWEEQRKNMITTIGEGVSPLKELFEYAKGI